MKKGGLVFGLEFGEIGLDCRRQGPAERGLLVG